MKGKFAAAVVLCIGLAACGEAPHAQPSGTEVQAASGTGTVTSLDPADGSITLDHGALPEIGWPEMTMTFEAGPALFSGIAEGDRVAFDLSVHGSAGTITALRELEGAK